MGRYFIIQEQNGSSLLFNAEKDREKIHISCDESMFCSDDLDAPPKDKALSPFYILPCNDLFFINHTFPFSNPKRIEKIISFELEPRLPVKNKKVSFLFDFIEKENPKAFCVGICDDILDEYEGLLNEKSSGCSGLIPYTHSIVLSWLDCLPESSDSIFMVRDISGVFFVYAISQDKILGLNRVNFSGDIKDVVNSVRALKNYIKMAVKGSFNPSFVKILNSHEECGNLHDELKLHSSGDISLVSSNDFNSFFQSDDSDSNGAVNIGVSLIGHFLHMNSSFVFRKKKPGIKKFFDTYKKEIYVSSVLFIFTLILLGFNTYDSIRTLKTEYRYTSALVSETLRKNFPGTVRVSKAPLKQAKAKLAMARKGSGKKSENVFFTINKLDLLKILSDSVPSGKVVLSRIDMIPSFTTLTGIADGYDIIDQIKKSLLSSQRINSVKIAMATSDNSGKIRFKLEIHLDDKAN